MVSVPPALAVHALGKSYGSTQALAGVDLEVREGELFGLLGPNGAGKSTLVKIACGLVRPTTGTAEVAGAAAGTPAAQRALGYLAELFRFPDWLSADELLVGAMSKGMQQRLGIAQAMVGSPRVLLLDEPTSALDPAGRRTVRRLLEELRAQGTSVLLNSHLLSEVELVCDRVAIIARGEVVAAGTPAELSTDGGVEIELASGTRTLPDARREDVPRIVGELVAAGEQVYGVRLLRSTLEDAYLEAVS
jgi:ABC-2 type transport system ATP-binding protein